MSQELLNDDVLTEWKDGGLHISLTRSGKIKVLVAKENDETVSIELMNLLFEVE